MSKHDFPAEEFAQRLARTRRAIAGAGLDWLLVIHPVSLHWLIGTDAKSYQAFQCLPVAADERPLVMFTRESERTEFEEDTTADAVRGWGGGEPEDPIEAFGRLADELGLNGKRVGLEVPAYYLHPHHYERLKAMLGSALVAEPINLIADLKMVKSPRELALIRRASGIADQAMTAMLQVVAEGHTELEMGAAIYHALLKAGSGLPASTLNLVTGERCAFSHGAPTERPIRRGECGNVELGAAYKRYTATLGRQFQPGGAGAAGDRAARRDPRRLRRLHRRDQARRPRHHPARGGKARHRRGRPRPLPHAHPPATASRPASRRPGASPSTCSAAAPTPSRPG